MAHQLKLSLHNAYSVTLFVFFFFSSQSSRRDLFATMCQSLINVRALHSRWTLLFRGACISSARIPIEARKMQSNLNFSSRSCSFLGASVESVVIGDIVRETRPGILMVFKSTARRTSWINLNENHWKCRNCVKTSQHTTRREEEAKNQKPHVWYAADCVWKSIRQFNDAIRVVSQTKATTTSWLMRSHISATTAKKMRCRWSIFN